MPETVIIPIALYQQLLDYLKDRTILSNQAKELVEQLEQFREAKMSQAFKTWATLKQETPFNRLFPDLKVPIVSPIPIIPREEGMPFCYVIDAQFLTDEQIQGLAEMLYEQWKPEAESIEATINYIREGLPLKCEWFSSFTTIDQKMMAALDDLAEPISEYELDEECDCDYEDIEL